MGTKQGLNGIILVPISDGLYFVAIFSILITSIEIIYLVSVDKRETIFSSWDFHLVTTQHKVKK